MRRTIIGALALAVGVLVWLWLSGGFNQIAVWAAGEQREFQNGIARTLRALRGGEAGAYLLLLGSCFAYGFFHAIGPGHGKLLVGGYGVAREVPMLRLSLIAFASSIGQAITAIVLAYGGLWLLGLTRDRMVGTAEDWLAPFSYALIAAIGGWLVVRGLRRIRRNHSTQNHGAPDHAHQGDDDVCSSCGHRHGPSLEEAEQVGGLREALILIAGIAIRPCTGALFVLIITWQMGIPWAGISGALVMALGTASVTIAVGIAASGFRGGVLRSLAQAGTITWIMPMLEVTAGLVVIALSCALLIRVL
ncbi:nickel/cobalt transporter [Sulfitobacter donghicola]|uniref:Nickel/cobalt efflux system n=1 Tax=Sulfitobacter donghicola DSW-25 = KCTC 12864 = JCM 14565 TaxID=1300350 RepID=A0A073IJE9_9RHOB|nr:membrane protein [Sulfitobacter donghicola]KEJ89710.1 membrane protein [Sulfitobacter donghicola DSW-25 = KCTC 12864 = JCM 14565]KIN67197.1 High-affinity nickel-transporter [Sulfitobacter donghicola DSW-25 = KCTC 12864 = JCM 14565]